MTAFIEMGQIVAAHGIKGMVKINPLTEPARLAAYAPFFDKDGHLINIEIKSTFKNQVLAVLKGVTDRNAAEEWRGVKLYIKRDALPQTDENEYYVCDLIGLTVVSMDGNTIGKITDIQNYGASDILEIKPQTGASFMVAFTKRNVPNIDFEKGTMTVDLPQEIEGEKNEG